MQAGEKSLEVRNLIGGSWEDRDGRDTEPVYDPATGEVVAQTPLSTREDVDRAVRQAEEAFSGWAATPVVERARVLFRFKALLEEHFEELREGMQGSQEVARNLMEGSERQMEAFQAMLGEAMNSYANLLNAPFDLYRKNLEAFGAQRGGRDAT